MKWYQASHHEDMEHTQSGRENEENKKEHFAKQFIISNIFLNQYDLITLGEAGD